MSDLYYVLLIIPISIITQFIRFKLTKWEDFVQKFGVEENSNYDFIYGFWSEFKHSPNSYPLSNKFLKVAVTPYGLYLLYDLKFEVIRFYKPVLIPWTCIEVNHSKESNSRGCDEYKIIRNYTEYGRIYLQVPISEEIINKADELGINLNFV